MLRPPRTQNSGFQAQNSGFNWRIHGEVSAAFSGLNNRGEKIIEKTLAFRRGRNYDSEHSMTAVPTTKRDPAALDPRGRPRIFDKHKRAAELRLSGMKWGDIAKELGVTRGTLTFHRLEIHGIMSTLQKGVPA
jgi:hypothetical protein